MILFCDTSALVKLYIAEMGSDVVARRVVESEAVAVCRIAWAEAHAALSRRAREVPMDVRTIDLAKAALAEDWTKFVILDVSQQLVEQAGDYADTFALRAYDAVQLAAASEMARITQSPVVFASFDARLNKAAKTLGMICI